MKKWIATLATLALVLALAAPALADVGDVMYVTKDRVKVYEEPDSDSEDIDKLYKGDEVVVVEDDYGSWVLVDTDSVRGFVKAKYLSEDEPHEHEWSDWEIEEEPTCTRRGLRTRECEICGEEQTDEIAKLDHEYDRWETVRKATCSRVGERVRECEICGYEQTEEIPKTPHEFGPWHVSVEATDYSAGVRSHICQVCGYEEEIEFDPDGTLRRGNRGEEVRELQELLVEQGYLKAGGADGSFGGGTETALKNFQRDQGLNPDGVAWPQTQKRLRHDFGPWTTETPLTREADGVRVRTCKDCGFEERQTVAAEPALMRRDRGETVRFVQTMLNDLGFNAGSADGSYGGKLDSAFTAFAAENNRTFTEGSVTPADIDALLNRWTAAQAADLWMGRAEDSADIDLTLTVIPTEDSAGDIRTYTWSLTNNGSQRCRFNALLLGFGADHDFKGDNIVLVADNEQLRGNGGNTLEGECTLSTDWGGLIVDSLNFCALVTSENGGEHWLSNNIVYNVAW